MKRHKRFKQSLADINSNAIQHLIVHRNMAGLRVAYILRSLIQISVQTPNTTRP